MCLTSFVKYNNFLCVGEKMINLQAKRSLLPHVSALVNKRELFMMKTEQRQMVWMELYLAVVYVKQNYLEIHGE